MIQPLMSNKNINFGNSKMQVVPAKNGQQAQSAPKEKAQQEPKESFFKKAKRFFVNIAKSFNNITNVGGGVARGVVSGGLTAATVAVIGKNCSKTKGFTFASIGGIIKDIATAAFTTIKHVPDVIMKSPFENIKTLATSAGKGIKTLSKGIKNHKATAAVATLSGLVVLAGSTIHGKAMANKKNAEIDHITNGGHTK